MSRSDSRAAARQPSGQDTEPCAFHHRARQTRRGAPARHVPSEFSEPSIWREGAQETELLAGRAERCGRRRGQPADALGWDAGGQEEQQELGQVVSLDLGCVLQSPRFEGALREEPNADAWRGTTGAARALRAARLADHFDLQALRAAPRVVPSHAREARVDHRGHARNGDGRFGDVGRENDAPSPTPLADRSGLLLDGHVAVQRQDLEAFELPQRFLATSDLARAGQKDEDVASIVRAASEGASHLDLERPLVCAGLVHDRDGKRTTFAANDGRSAQKPCHGRGVQRGAHGDDAKVGSSLPESPGEREQRVDLGAPFVDLVEHERRYTGQTFVLEQLAQDECLGGEDQTRVLRRPILEPHPIAHLAPEFAPAFFGDARRRQAGGDTPWFGHQDLPRAPRLAQKPGGQTRRLAGARRGLDHDRLRACERAEHVLECGVDGQGRETRHRTSRPLGSQERHRGVSRAQALARSGSGGSSSGLFGRTHFSGTSMRREGNQTTVASTIPIMPKLATSPRLLRP